MRLLPLSFLLPVFLSASPATWRLPDGVLTSPPPEAATTADSTLVIPGLTGVPAFPLPFSLHAHDVVAVELTVETVQTSADFGAEGQAGVILTFLPTASKTSHNPDAEHRQIIIVGSEPEPIRYAFRVRSAHAAGELLFLASPSYFDRTVRLSSLTFTRHGPETDPQSLTASSSSYDGQALDSPWRAKAAARIEAHRKSDLRIIVTDRLGQPRPEVAVSIEQLRHAYSFGTAIVSSRVFNAPRVFTPESGMTPELWASDNARYVVELERNFNTVVTENDLKWPQWAYANRTPGVYDQSWTLDALSWLRSRGFTIKGHTLVWGSWRFTPPWLRDHENDPETVQRAALTHIRDIGDATAGLAHYWDVVNEPMSHRNIIELVGMENVAAWFHAARAVLPLSRLVMNEFDLVGNGGNANRRAGFLAFYEELRSYEAPIDVIGFQGHFWSERFTPPERVWEIIDEVHEATNLPVMISEFDSNFPNEQLQADYTRDFLTAWFAHPATEAFIMWGFWGGAHWMGDAGAMFRRDWSPKPNLAAWRDLVYRDWWTRANVHTDDQGTATVRAFHGRHRLTLTGDDGTLFVRELDLPAGGRNFHVVLP